MGQKITAADVSHVGWVLWAGWAGVEIEEFQSLKAWRDRMMADERVREGNDVPQPSEISKLLGDPEKVEEYARHHSGWIMKANEKDTQ